MNCNAAEDLLHLLIDGEIDAPHVKAHVAACRRCATRLAQYRALRATMVSGALRFAAPTSLRARIDARLPHSSAWSWSWRPLLKGWNLVPSLRGLAFGSALSAAAALGLVVGVLHTDPDQAVVSDVVSAHLRSLNSDHLTDIVASDQRAIKPWFVSRLAAAPPVPDLSRDGISLVGARIDYVRGQPVAALVYERDHHLINLFVAPGDGADRAAKQASLAGINVALWSERGLKFCVVADVSADALQNFRQTFDAAWTGQT
jgi:anti-sigma factor RsiW